MIKIFILLLSIYPSLVVSGQEEYVLSLKQIEKNFETNPKQGFEKVVFITENTFQEGMTNEQNTFP